MTVKELLDTLNFMLVKGTIKERDTVYIGSNTRQYKLHGCKCKLKSEYREAKEPVYLSFDCDLSKCDEQMNLL